MMVITLVHDFRFCNGLVHVHMHARMHARMHTHTYTRTTFCTCFISKQIYDNNIYLLRAAAILISLVKTFAIIIIPTF